MTNGLIETAVFVIKEVIMKALSIKQPWLYCITDLDKRVENRTWKPPNWIIGERIALHASKSFDKLGAPTACELSKIDLFNIEMPFGAIVATAIVRGWVNEDGFVSHPLMKSYMDDKWFFGPFGWILDDIRKVSPGPLVCTGALGLWDVNPKIYVFMA